MEGYNQCVLEEVNSCLQDKKALGADWECEASLATISANCT